MQNILIGTFMLGELPPWFEKYFLENKKKSPKIYFRNSGILHDCQGSQMIMHATVIQK